MDVSVIVCTRNRAAQLPRMLASMENLVIPADISWELVVVDNGSTDATAQIIDSFAGRLPVKRIFQPMPGKSNALNLGIDHAAGTYFLHTDDDVELDSGWLAAYAAAFKRWPDAALFAGMIMPSLEPPTPLWFRRSLGDLTGLLARRDFGPEPIPLSIADEVMPFGANFAVRAVEQKRFRYNPDLGVAPGRRMGGEETDVAIKILQSGRQGWWVPEAKVTHLITSARQSVAYIMEYYSAIGAHDVFQARQKSPRLLGSIRPALWIKLPVCFVKYRISRLFNRASWVRHLTSYAFRYGEFSAWRAQTPLKKTL